MADEMWTIGHGTSAQDEFTNELTAQRIEVLADVRSFPGSRHNPQFGREAMAEWLPDAGIDYVHLPDLGGRRRKQDVPPEVNGGWRLDSFHNYADYTPTDAFRQALVRLEVLARSRRVALMCGESVPWRCHRSLIANALVARGWIVWDLIGESAPRRHELGAWGAHPVVDADRVVTYPAPDDGDTDGGTSEG